MKHETVNIVFMVRLDPWERSMRTRILVLRSISSHFISFLVSNILSYFIPDPVLSL